MTGKEHLEDQGVTWDEHRQMSWCITWQCLHVALLTFIHGLFPSFMSVSILPIFKDIMPNYYKKHEGFLKK